MVKCSCKEKTHTKKNQRKNDVSSNMKDLNEKGKKEGEFEDDGRT